jgi:hypothetical protein
MSKPLINRLEKLETDAHQTAPPLGNLHMTFPIINPDGTVHEVLETIIQNGVVICSNAPMEKPWPAIR